MHPCWIGFRSDFDYKEKYVGPKSIKFVGRRVMNFKMEKL